MSFGPVSLWEGNQSRENSVRLISMVASLVEKNAPAHAGVVGSIPRLGRSPGEKNGNQLQYSCLGNGVDRGACGLQCMELQRSLT